MHNRIYVYVHVHVHVAGGAWTFGRRAGVAHATTGGGSRARRHCANRHQMSPNDKCDLLTCERQRAPYAPYGVGPLVLF